MPKRRTKTKAPGVFRSISGRYEVVFKDSSGKLRSEVIGDNFEEAKAARADRMATMARGGKVVRTRDNFGDYAETWIASLSRRPRTLDAYRYALDRHILPRFKNRRVADITPDDVARMVSEMRRAGYSEWTISGAVSTLSGCLSKALRRGLIASNACRALAADERPKQRSGKKRVLSETEIRAVLDGATDRFRPLIAVMLFAGVRIGELLALRWDDVDFDEGFLRVRFQLSPKRELVELKTDSGRRDVVLIGELGKTLREHRMASRFKAPTDFVFCTAEGRGRDQRSTARGVERAIEAAKLNGQGISSHNFRHTYASLLIVGLKLDPVVVAGQLGHANPAVTLGTYAHLFDRARHADETRERLSAGFGHLLGSKAASS